MNKAEKSNKTIWLGFYFMVTYALAWFMVNGTGQNKIIYPVAEPYFTSAPNQVIFDLVVDLKIILPFIVIFIFSSFLSLPKVKRIKEK